MDKSQNLQSQDYTNYTKTLDSQEQERTLPNHFFQYLGSNLGAVFYLGYDAAKDFDRWQARISHRIPRSSMLPEQKRS